MKRKLLAATAAFAVLVTPLAAQQDPHAFPVKARQGIMAILAMNIGVLSNMARGNTDYDAAAAQSAADAILGVSMVDMVPLLPEGSDDMMRDGTRAAAAIWDDVTAYTTEWAAVNTGAMALAAVAGDGKDAMAAALGGVGGTCRSCHMKFRAPE